MRHLQASLSPYAVAALPFAPPYGMLLSLLAKYVDIRNW